MNPRERYIETLRFGAPDRVPFHPGNGRISTRKAWHQQGLPSEIAPERIAEYAYRQAGGTLPWPEEGKDFPVSERMIPMFEEKILEERETSRIVQDWKGNICEISNEYPVDYLRNPVDFVTRRWIRCPVGTRADWEQIKGRYDPDDPARYPKDAQALAAELKTRTWPVKLQFSGPFWQLREWLGFERLCMSFCDEPEFLREMIDFWQSYISRILENTLVRFVPDEVHLSEDMAYKMYSISGRWRAEVRRSRRRSKGCGLLSRMGATSRVAITVSRPMSPGRTTSGARGSWRRLLAGCRSSADRKG